MCCSGNGDDIQTHLNLPQHNERLFQCLLDYLYTGSYDWRSTEDNGIDGVAVIAAEALVVADKYELPQLRSLALVHLEETLNVPRSPSVFFAISKKIYSQGKHARSRCQELFKRELLIGVAVNEKADDFETLLKEAITQEGHMTLDISNALRSSTRHPLDDSTADRGLQKDKEVAKELLEASQIYDDDQNKHEDTPRDTAGDVEDGQTSDNQTEDEDDEDIESGFDKTDDETYEDSSEQDDDPWDEVTSST